MICTELDINTLRAMGSCGNKAADEIAELRAALATVTKTVAEREAECLKLREVSDMWLLATIKDRGDYIGQRAITRKALSTTPNTSYLEQWVANNFKVVGIARRLDSPVHPSNEQDSYLQEGVQLYTRKD